jgi:hypothetical protein
MATLSMDYDKIFFPVMRKRFLEAAASALNH